MITTRRKANNSKPFIMPIMAVSTISGIAGTIAEDITQERFAKGKERARDVEKVAKKFLESYRPNENYGKEGMEIMIKKLVSFNRKHLTRQPVVMASFGLWLAEYLEGMRKPSNKKKFVIAEKQREILRELIEKLDSLNIYFDKSRKALRHYAESASMAEDWKKLY